MNTIQKIRTALAMSYPSLCTNIPMQQLIDTVQKKYAELSDEDIKGSLVQMEGWEILPDLPGNVIVISKRFFHTS